MDIICPFCKAEGKELHPRWLKALSPILFLEKKYQCKKCKETFDVSYKLGDPLKEKSKIKVSVAFIILILIFF